MRIKNAVTGIVLLLFFFPLFSFSQTVVFKTVKKSGGNFSSLKTALEAIPQDLVQKNETWTIEIQDEGPYVQDVARIFNKRTDARHQIVVRAASGVTPQIQSFRGVAFQISRASYVTLEGLKFIGERGHGVSVDMSSHVTIKNSIVAGAAYQGITFYRVQSSSIMNSRIYSCNVGIFIVDSAKNQIENNFIYHTFFTGITLGFNASSNLMRNNVLFNNPTGLSIDHSTGVSNQFIYNVMDGGSRGEYFYRIATTIPPQTIFDFNQFNIEQAKLARVGNQEVVSLSQWQLMDQDLQSVEEKRALESLGIDFGVQKVKKSIAKRRGDFSSLQGAVAAMPRNLVAANQAWEIEFEDSETYQEFLSLAPITSPEHTLVIRVKNGQTPRLEALRRDAVMLYGAQYVTIEGLTIAPGAYRGINLSQCRFCVVKKCTIEGVWGAGISIFGGFQNQITENTVRGSAVALELYSYAQANVIKDNIFYRNKAYGITLNSSPMNEISGNILFNNGYFELWISDNGGGTKFIKNILYNEGKWGAVSLENGIPYHAQFDQNIYYVPIGPIGRVGRKEYYSSKGSMFRIFSRKGERSYRMVYTSYPTLGEWQLGTGLDLSSEFKDPQFRSTLLGQEDFRIHPAEPPAPNPPEEESILENNKKDKKEDKEEDKESKDEQNQKDTPQPKKEDKLNQLLRRN
ncbi:MAG: right-handed parallel beta-helix repeat-containing protein [Deltaproteobacteria bacterium]|nr:right-handed parallel beta-helix repeat-containing protein [Deltaproteobacteria bacterium]MBI3017055.1 right-handed parallel beta-helix repeat-containing protein [Deltaproteobacteria bacterium]